jgi:ribosome biogenesis GTPase
MTGIVVKSTGSWYVVRETATGQLHRCRLRGKFKNKGLKVSNPLAVGDVVDFEVPEQSEGAGVIHTIQPRRNYIIRRSVHKSEHAHIVAANLDQALLVVTLRRSGLSTAFSSRPRLITCRPCSFLIKPTSTTRTRSTTSSR